MQYMAVPRNHFSELEQQLQNASEPFEPTTLTGDEAEKWIQEAKEWGEKNKPEEPKDQFDDYLKRNP